MKWKDLAPKIIRQRAIIEGKCDKVIDDRQIKLYLSQLSEEIKMIKLIEPVTHQSPQFGWSGWIHWETSGAHFYAWDKPTPFFSVDIYTCKAFSAEKAAKFTRNFFKTTELTWREV